MTFISYLGGMNTTVVFSIVLAVVVVAAAIIAFLISRKATRDKNALNERIVDLTARKASLEASLKAQEKSFGLLKEEYARALDSMKDSFKAYTAEAGDVLNRKSAESVTMLLKPIQDKFQEFNNTVKENQIKAGEQNASMRTLIEQVMQQSRTVGDEAKNLANALTGYSKVQGDFGEMLLTDVLKNAGMVEGVHYVTQGVITDDRGHEIKSDSGAAMIPDVMVLYPDDTSVIVDSKVSMNAYKNYMNADTVELRTRYAREHVASVRSHVDELKRKDYASYIPEGRSKVDYNIMFIPMEGAFRLMLEKEPMLWQTAKDNNVLIVSQMTLVIVLNMIMMSWRQHNQEKNIAEVYSTASELMSQINAWMGSYMKIGEFLGKASDAYEESKRKLVDSNQSVVRKIDKLEKLGASPRKSGAKIKPGARMVMGRESVIPAELADELKELE